MRNLSRPGKVRSNCVLLIYCAPLSKLRSFGACVARLRVHTLRSGGTWPGAHGDFGDSAQVASEATMPREHLCQAECQDAVSPGQPLRNYGSHCLHRSCHSTSRQKNTLARISSSRSQGTEPASRQTASEDIVRYPRAALFAITRCGQRKMATAWRFR
ncbi:hypothetical protein ACJJTC_000948 [Scirpophaga incertulas]